MVIDFHSHLRPKRLVEALANSNLTKIETDTSGKKIMVEKYTYIDVPQNYMSGESSVKHRIEEMNQNNLATQVLSVPRSHDYPSNIASKLCAVINDSYHEISQQNPDSFVALASLPLTDIDAALKELDRSINDLELNGVVIGGNVGGVSLDDQMFWPLFEKLDELDVPVFIHPGLPPWGSQGITKYHLGITLGYPFDTLISATRIIYSGLLDQFSKISFVLSHLGDGLPFFINRLSGIFYDKGKEDPAGPIKAKKEPINYVRRFYFDTAVGDLDSYRHSLDCTIAIAGPDRVLFGTDFPWNNWQFVSGLRKSIETLGVPESTKRMILNENSKRILKIS